MPIAAATALAESLHMPMQNLTVAIVLFSAYPLALIYAYLPAKAATTKHVFSIAVTTFLFLTLVDAVLFVQLLAACLAAYTLVSVGRQSAYTPMAVFLGILGILSYHHLQNQLIDPDPKRTDNTGPVMMMVIKLSTFAWAAHDGTKPKESLTREQQRTAIHHMPTLLEFLGYAFFFGGWLVGPANDFSEYRRFTRGETPFENIPPRGIATLRTFLMGMLTLGIYIKFAEPLSHWGCLTESYAERPFWWRLMYINLAGNVVRCKYYGVWKLAEGADNLAGIGYLGPSPTEPGKQIFARVQNVEPLTLELAQSPRDYIGAWNQQTGKWLRNCVYMRLAPAASPVSPDNKKDADVSNGKAHRPKQTGNPAVANIATYLTSAIWHGFRPGYYLTFLSGALVTLTGQLLRRNLRPLVVEPSRLAPWKPIYDLLGWAATQVSINYICAPFPVYWLANGVKVWGSVGYVVHVWNAAAFVVFSDVVGGARICRRIGRSVGAAYPSRGGGAATKAEVGGGVDDVTETLLVSAESETVKGLRERERRRA
ncbi:lysophospholipid acyltransferase [Thoreauomyces humboldtii]|nr:lysophospholipid acyltransferase [Thoreauomyces humboldtii]